MKCVRTAHSRSRARKSTQFDLLVGQTRFAGREFSGGCADYGDLGAEVEGERAERSHTSGRVATPTWTMEPS